MPYGCGHTSSPCWRHRSHLAFQKAVSEPGAGSICVLCTEAHMFCKVTCQHVAVATAHLSESSAPRWPSRLAGSQRGAMRCRPPVALRGLHALPPAALVCTQQERGGVDSVAGQTGGRPERQGVVSALPATLAHGIKPQRWTQAVGALQVMSTPGR